MEKVTRTAVARVLLGVGRGFLAVAVIFMLGSACDAAALPGTAFAAGPWNGAAYGDDDTGQFSHCAAGASYKSGIYFVLSLASDGATWGLGFMDPNWRLTVGQSYEVSFAIDRLWQTNAHVTANEDHMVLANTKNRQFMAALQAGQTLSVTTPSTRFSFNLTYSARVVNALETCVNLRAGGNPFVRQDGPSSNPFGAPADSAHPPAQASTGDPKVLAVTYLTSLINGGQMTNFSLVAPRDAPANMRGDALLWTNGSVNGGLVIVPRSTTVDEQQAAILADDAKSCANGSFASGSRTDALFGSRRIFTACKAAGTIGVSYSLIPLKVGGAFELFNGSSSSEEAQQADDLFFRQLTSGKPK